MYIHKYVSDGDTFYRVSEGSSKPAGTVVLNVSDWKARVSPSARVKQSLKSIEMAFAGRESIEEKEERKEEKEEKEEKKASYTTVADGIRAVSRALEK